MATFVAQPSTRVLLDPSKKKRRHDSVVKVQMGGGAAGDKKPGDAYASTWTGTSGAEEPTTARLLRPDPLSYCVCLVRNE